MLALRRDVQQWQRFSQQEPADNNGGIGFAETAIQTIRFHPVSPR